MNETEPASRPALTDLSALPRFGLKGGSTHAWLDARDYRVGGTPNQAYPQDDGSLVARLSPRELLFLCDPERPDLAMDHDYFTPGRECYMIRRQDSHCWFAMTGERTSSVLAKLCGVNFDSRKFANHQLAQTRLAATSTIVLRNDQQDTLRYYLLGDSSCAAYLWECLLDAIAGSER